MLVANKLVMHYIPAPSLVSLIQLLACTGIILVGKMLGILQLDAVETPQLRWLSLYSGSVYLFFVKSRVSLLNDLKECKGDRNLMNFRIVFRLALKPSFFHEASFVSGIYFSLAALSHANVETVIVARSCLPLATSILDYVFLGRQVNISAIFQRGYSH